MTRVLILDDEPIIGLDVCDHLVQVGIKPVGPATTVTKALELIQAVGCDAAILDVRLAGETSEAVALELRRLGIPFLTLSGYAEELPRAFGAAPRLVKPVRMPLLIAKVRELLAAANA